MTLALLVGELGLRAIGFREEAARRATVFDPRYGTVRADSWIFDFAIDEGAIEANLRGQRVPIAKGADELRVLFVGDSGTEGVRLPLDKTFPQVFEHLLDEEHPGHGVRAINAGVFGMTTIDELHFLQSKLLPLAPDVVVVGVFMANDVNFNLGHEERIETRAPRSELLARLCDRSALAQFLFVEAVALNARHRWLRADDMTRDSVLPREISLVDSYGLHMLSYPMGEIATYEREPSRLVEHGFEVLESVLGKLAELGEAHAFSVRVLIIPTPSTITGRLTLLHYPDIWDELRDAGVSLRPRDLDFDAPTRRVLESCERLGLVCIDPTPRMREVGMEVFFPDDEHPSERGHAVLGRALADRYPDIVGRGRP